MVNTYWNMASASVRGFAHVHHKIVCQDKVKTAYINGIHVMALADGMGSYFLSDIGAQIAVDSACTFIAENFHVLTTLSADRAIEDINSAVQEVLEEMANRLDVGLENLASTLLVVAVCGNDTLAFHCGDGFIGLEKEDGTFIEVQIKARSSEVTDGGAALFAAITHELTPNFYFVFYSERLDLMWIMSSVEFLQECVTNKTG